VLAALWARIDAVSKKPASVSQAGSRITQTMVKRAEF